MAAPDHTPDRGTDYALRFVPGFHRGAAGVLIRPGDSLYRPNEAYPHMASKGACTADRRGGSVRFVAEFPVYGLHACNVEKGTDKEENELVAELTAPEITNRCGTTLMEEYSIAGVLPMSCSTIVRSARPLAHDDGLWADTRALAALNSFRELTGLPLELHTCPALVETQPCKFMAASYLLARVPRAARGTVPSVPVAPGLYVTGIAVEFSSEDFAAWCRARRGEAGVDEAYTKGDARDEVGPLRPGLW